MVGRTLHLVKKVGSPKRVGERFEVSGNIDERQQIVVSNQHEHKREIHFS